MLVVVLVVVLVLVRCSLSNNVICSIIDSNPTYSIEETQLYISIAMVIGPTPPGTGVIALVCGATFS